MKSVYCSKCNTQLPTTRKALKQFNVIIDQVDPHLCVDPPIELNFKEVVVPKFGQTEPVQNLNRLSNPEGDFRDRRPAEHIRPPDSSAPTTLLEQFRHLQNSIPANDPGEEPDA